MPAKKERLTQAVLSPPSPSVGLWNPNRRHNRRYRLPEFHGLEVRRLKPVLQEDLGLFLRLLQ